MVCCVLGVICCMRAGLACRNSAVGTNGAFYDEHGLSNMYRLLAGSAVTFFTEDDKMFLRPIANLIRCVLSGVFFRLQVTCWIVMVIQGRGLNKQSLGLILGSIGFTEPQMFGSRLQYHVAAFGGPPKAGWSGLGVCHQVSAT